MYLKRLRVTQEVGEIFKAPNPVLQRCSKQLGYLARQLYILYETLEDVKDAGTSSGQLVELVKATHHGCGLDTWSEHIIETTSPECCGSMD